MQVQIKVLHSNELIQQKTIELLHGSMMLFEQVGQSKFVAGGREEDWFVY